MKDLRRLFKESRMYILAAGLIFMLGWLLGALFSEQFHALATPLLEHLQEMAETMVQDEKTKFEMGMMIYVNNIVAALFMMVAGVFLFLIPVWALFANGVLVGYLLSMTSAQGGDVGAFDMFLYGILPHGILELPAIFVAGGIGMFLGIRLLKWLFGRDQFFSHLTSDTKDVGLFWREKTVPVIKHRAKALGQLVIVLAIVLFIAAIIESFVTPELLKNIM